MYIYTCVYIYRERYIIYSGTTDAHAHAYVQWCCCWCCCAVSVAGSASALRAKQRGWMPLISACRWSGLRLSLGLDAVDTVSARLCLPRVRNPQEQRMHKRLSRRRPPWQWHCRTAASQHRFSTSLGLPRARRPRQQRSRRQVQPPWRSVRWGGVGDACVQTPSRVALSAEPCVWQSSCFWWAVGKAVVVRGALCLGV